MTTTTETGNTDRFASVRAIERRVHQRRAEGAPLREVYALLMELGDELERLGHVEPARKVWSSASHLIPMFALEDARRPRRRWFRRSAVSS